MENGAELYKAISERKTAAQRWNDLPDAERLKYLMQYVEFKEEL